MTQSTSHLASSPELSWPIWTVVSFPKFWHCNKEQFLLDLKTTDNSPLLPPGTHMISNACFPSISLDLYCKYFQTNTQSVLKSRIMILRQKKHLETKLLKGCEEITFFVVSTHFDCFWEPLITNFWGKAAERCALVEETGLQYTCFQKGSLIILTFGWLSLHYKPVPNWYCFQRSVFQDKKSLTWVS